LTFAEEWEYDRTTFKLEKKIKSVCLNRKDYDKGISIETLFLPFNREKLPASPADDISAVNITTDFKIPGGYYKELADFSFFRKKMIADIQSKNILLYDTLYPFNKLMDQSNRSGLLEKMGTATSFQFLEDWKMNAVTQTFEKTVKGILFIKDSLVNKEADGYNLELVVSKKIAFVPFNGF